MCLFGAEGVREQAMGHKVNTWTTGAHAASDHRNLSDISYALEVEPQNVEVRFNYALKLEEHGRYEDAEKEYRKVTEAKPECTEAYVQYGNLLRKTSRANDAEAQYRKAISVNPRDFGAHFSYATLLEEQNRLEEAEDEYVSAACGNRGHSR
jgi:tetratricopeptide (TPR) repeat protein